MTDWKTVKLGDVAYEISERVDNPSTSGYDRFVGLENFVSGDFRISSWGTTENLISAMKLFKAGDTLFARRNAYLKRASMADFDGICSGDAIVLRNNEKMIDGFLPLILNTDHFWNYAIANAAGSMSKRVRVEDLMKYEFPLPPVDEQRRIVDLLWAADDQLQSLKEAIANHGTLLKSFILDEYRSAAANYPSKRVDELGEILMGRQKAPKYTKGINPRPFLKVINIGDLEINLTDLEEMDFSDREIAKYKLIKGDILLTEGDLISRFNVGRPAIFNGEVEECCFQNTLIRFRCKENLIPDYALVMLEGARISGNLAQVAKSTTVTHLGVGRFATLEIPVSPIEIQREAEKKLQELLSTRNALLVHHENSVNLAKKLINENLS